MRMICIPVALLATCSAVLAQPVAAPAPVTAPATSEAAPVAAPAPAPRKITLPAESPIKLTIVDSLSSKKAKLGDKFAIVTLDDVAQDGVVIIPKDTKGEGSISFRGGSGSFGKSGRLEIAFESLMLNGQKITITGKYRDEGKGNGGAATGAVLAVGLVGGLFVHGHAAKIEKGEVMAAQTVDPITVDAPVSAPAPASN